MQERQNENERKSRKFPKELNDTPFKFGDVVYVCKEIIQCGRETADTDSPDGDAGEEGAGPGRKFDFPSVSILFSWCWEHWLTSGHYHRKR
ncbi:MAG: hypothetical protein ACOX6D_10700 [Thermoguttaceae bacterium]